MSGSDNTGPEDGTGREPDHGAGHSAGEGMGEGGAFGARNDELGAGGEGPPPFGDADDDADQLLLAV